MKKSIVVVALWNHQAAPVPAEEHAYLKYSSPTIGLIGSLLLHAVVLHSALWGGVTHPAVHKPGATLVESSAATAEMLTLIELPKTHKGASEQLQEFAVADEARRKALSTLISPSPLLLSMKINPVPIDEKPEAVAADGGDSVEAARLFGVYSGQIKARIDRVWRRPRTPVSEGEPPSEEPRADDTFRCQVQIVQDSSGNVQEILLPYCNGSVAWQRALVLAIQQASPLPAPPNAAVFRSTITLSFVGFSYRPGSSADDYESLPIQARQ